jgi:hypothetical protein
MSAPGSRGWTGLGGLGLRTTAAAAQQRAAAIRVLMPHIYCRRLRHAQAASPAEPIASSAMLDGSGVVTSDLTRTVTGPNPGKTPGGRPSPPGNNAPVTSCSSSLTCVAELRDLSGAAARRFSARDGQSREVPARSHVELCRAVPMDVWERCLTRPKVKVRGLYDHEHEGGGDCRRRTKTRRA